MKLLDFLRACRDDLWAKEVKLIRHVEEDWDLEMILRAGCFDEYQSRQGSEVFNCELIVSFIGESGTRSRFIDVYQVRGVREDAKTTPYSSSFIFPEMGRAKFRYDLVPVDGFDALRDRLVVDWGAGMRSWHQWLGEKSNKRVIEYRPLGYVREFSGFDDVHLRFDELERIVKHPDANRLWHTMLGGVAGVYLIVDEATGDQYVGSAYGDDGLLGRWRTYVATKHGGNKRLRKLLDEHPDRFQNFSFSILRTLSRSLTAKEVIAVEQHFKRKLGTHAFGLNEN